jgi:pimeloyl-ACP methyl ester carboxylesterase
LPAVNVDGIRVDYADAGMGLPLVFVPGLFGSADWFRYQTSGLSDRYRVIACNLRPAHGRADYSLDLLANDLLRLLDKLHVHEAVVVGHTLGAMVALKFAATHPERALAAVLVSAAPSFVGVSEEDLLSRLSPGEVEQESFWGGLWKRLTGARAAVEDEGEPLAYLARHGGAVDKATLTARLRLLRDADISPVFSDLEPPALVIAGAMDWPRILGGSQLIDQGLPDSAIEVIEGADHFCFFTRHDIFNAVLDDFVSHRVPRS